jgi:hypothetical protein
MVPQHDHRYGYFWLFDARVQQAFDSGQQLPYGVKVSLQVLLVGYNPRENHWRPRQLLPSKEQEYLEFNFSRRLPPPTGMSAEDIDNWDLQPEGEVTSDPRYSPGLESAHEDVPPPVPGPSRRKRKAASPAPAHAQPVKRLRSTVTMPHNPRPAPSDETSSRKPRPATADDLLRVTLLPVNPVILLTDFKVPQSLTDQQHGLLETVIHELTSLAGPLTTAATSWNNAIAGLRHLGQRSGFSANLPMVSMHEAPDLDWEKTPVDPQDRKGKKAAW